MAKILLKRTEIERMIIDQLGCKKVVWDEDGNAEINLDINEIKKNQEIIRDIRPYPIYVDKPEPYKPWKPYYNKGPQWMVSSKNNLITYKGEQK
jgi:hypothetical protein